MLLLQKKDQLGITFKSNFVQTIVLAIFLCCTILNFSAKSAEAYQTALVNCPENHKNWVQVYFGKQYGEVISQWIPAYSDKSDWTESMVFHSYNWAKGNSCYKFMLNLLNTVESRNKTMRQQIIKKDPVDSIAIWCAEKTPSMPAQCEIVRVTAGYEGLISIHYINKNPRQYFLDYQKDMWLNVVKDVRIFYSHYRWNKTMGKATSVQLQ